MIGPGSEEYNQFETADHAYQRGYEAGYQEGLKHGGDDGLDIAIPLSWDAAIEAAAKETDALSALIRKLKKP